ncbi:MAG: hypothetical protein BWZ10_01146 [candidate division BRC1 bacterium ADurb.BinA364]|nr:MAG: hypothetical protein BWZ10_01146 [candidate division BRC1 bacterium ADurb.BinA364]
MGWIVIRLRPSEPSRKPSPNRDSSRFWRSSIAGGIFSFQLGMIFSYSPLAIQITFGRSL